MAVLQQASVATKNPYEPEIQPEIEAALKAVLELELPSEDGIPLETNWHRCAMNLLIDSVHSWWGDRQDYFVGGNMFIYFSVEQALNRDYRGPDFFVVKEVDGKQERDSWVVWNEAGRYPNLIVELASRSTIKTDLETQKALYAQTFRTPEYFCYDPDQEHLYAWELTGEHQYVPMEANSEGRFWSQELKLWIGLWI
jgi:Uma2 family endonuclease